MNNKFISVLTIAFTLSLSAFAWGKVGHATVAQVAENHLTKKAKKVLRTYLDGMPIAAIASDGDTYRAYWTTDLGYKPTNPDVARPKWVKEFDFSTPTNIAIFPHTFVVDENGNAYHTDNMNGEYFSNAIYSIDKLIQKLKYDVKRMNPKERRIAISMLVHLVGDMHCPMHVSYNPKDTSCGFVKVTIGGKETNLHKYWDDELFATLPWGFIDMARMVDNLSKKEQKVICKGDVYDWAKDSAEKSWPSHQVEVGAQFKGIYPYDMRPLCFSQLRNGGYRLATLLNEIFG